MARGSVHPVSVYALDATYSHLGRSGCRLASPMPVCTTPVPIPAGNGTRLLPQGPSPCFDPYHSHAGADYLPPLLTEGWIYRLSRSLAEEGLQARGRDRAWLLLA